MTIGSRVHDMAVRCLLFVPLLVMSVHSGPDCHCTSGCDLNFKCLPEGQCTSGWLGPTCQIRNIAFGKATKQNGSYRRKYSSLAVDGVRSMDFNSGTCSHTDSSNRHSPAWWSVDLGGRYLVNNITIYLTYDGRMHGLRIEVDGHLCFKLIPTWPRSPENITCNTPLYGRNVTVSIGPEDFDGTQPVLAICEFKILECGDGTYGQDCTLKCGRCLGGEACGKTEGECAECEEGFSMPLCQSFKCGDGTYGNNCTLRCGRCLGGEACGKIEGECNECEEGFSLPLCQKCNEGYYGPNCERCGRCQGKGTCNKITGQCQEGCRAGWKDDKCLQECTQGSYGLKCSHKCGHCVLQCDPVDGSCGQEGCIEDWIGQECKRDDFRKWTLNIAAAGSIKVFDVIESRSPDITVGTASVTTDGNTNLTSCVTISGTQPSWKINFEKQHVIRGLVLYTPLLGHRFDLNVLVNEVTCYHWSSLPQFPDQNVFPCYEPVPGRSVSIYAPRGDVSKNFTLCEVQIYASITDTVTTSASIHVHVTAAIASCVGILVTAGFVLVLVFVARRKLGCFKPKRDEQRYEELIKF